MADKRADDRHETFAYWAALDLETGRLIGMVVDVNQGGFQLHTGHPIEVDTVCALSVQVDNNVAGCDRLNLEARSLWCRKVAGKKLYAVGFKVIAPYREFRRVEQKLIDYFSLRSR